MRCSLSARALGALLLPFSAQTIAAAPPSGTLSESTPLAWAGDAPFVFPNVSPASGMPQCVGEPVACDTFALAVDVSEAFRKDEKNKKALARITVSWPNASGAGDFDVYFYDASGALVGEAATSANPEVIVVPVSVLKNGAYSFSTIPFAPLAENYSATAEVSTSKSGNLKALSVEPAIAAAGETVRFDARSLASAPPAGGYRFSFGDGSNVTDADGVVEHTYASDGNYLARVSFTDPNGVRGSVSSAQTVAVNSAASGTVAAVTAGLPGKGGALTLGAFGFPALLGLFGLAFFRLRSK